MNTMNQQSTDFKEGDRVRVIDDCTAPGFMNHIGIVVKPSLRYPFRVAVRLYVDRDDRMIHFHRTELRKEPPEGN